ncbi:Hyalin [Holothuria leucospilota]|uniref:Hyalin n=1 Tax=Holothuria leucospilota TaxID=206669 RepID=A0A9Q1CCM4_HOLLE|nr:Hyalin [Holothuria leucospilota]
MIDCSGLDIIVTAPFNQPCANVDLPSCSATSNAGTVIQVSQSPPSGSCFSIGVTTVTNTFRDSNGLQGSGSFTVTVNQVAPPGPMIDCSGLDVIATAPLNQPCANVNLPSCSATSSAGTVIQVSQSPPSGSCFSIGVTTVTNTFRDSNGLQGFGTFTVTVNPGDTIPPVVDCSEEDFSVSAPGGSSGVIVMTLPRCRATDNSGQANFLSQTPSPGSFFSVGANEVTVVYQDPSGNTGSDSFIVTVTPVDIESPIVDCSGEDVITTAPGGAPGVTVTNLPRCRATDNSGRADFVSQNPLPGSFFPIGDTMVTVVYRDPSGNTGVGFFTVTVVAVDIEPPVVDCSGEDVTVTAPGGAPGVTVTNLPRCRAIDNSGRADFISQNPPPGSFFPIGDTMVTVVYRDPSGNTGVGFFTVTVVPGKFIPPFIASVFNWKIIHYK